VVQIHTARVETDLAKIMYMGLFQGHSMAKSLYIVFPIWESHSETIFLLIAQIY